MIGMQIIEGTTDSVLYENFIYQILHSVISDGKSKNKHIVILMDNAVIHKHS